MRPTLTLTAFKKLREELYSQTGTLGDLAERTENQTLAVAYDRACESLDAIDKLGYELGYLDSETNEYVDGDAATIRERE